MPESKWEMPAVCHLLNLTCIQEMKSYRAPLSEGLAGEGSCPSQTRKMTGTLKALEYAEQELAALESRASAFSFIFANAPPLTPPQPLIPCHAWRSGKEKEVYNLHLTGFLSLILRNSERPSIGCSGPYKDWDGGPVHLKRCPCPWLWHSVLPGQCLLREGEFLGHRHPAGEGWASSSLQKLLAASLASYHTVWSSHCPRPALLTLSKYIQGMFLHNSIVSFLSIT